MRHWVLLTVAAVLASLPSAAALADSWQLSSDAPVELVGPLRVPSPDLALYHRAFRDGTLHGTVYVGKMVEWTKTYSIDPKPECTTIRGAAESHMLAASEGEETQRFRFSLAAGSLVRAQFPAGLSYGEGQQLAAALGPNPYPRETQQDPYYGPVPEEYALAFPQSAFVLAPRDGFSTGDRFDLTLQWGTLQVWFGPAAQPSAFPVTVVDHEERSSDGTIPPNPLTQERTCWFRTVTWYQIEGTLATLLVEQDGMDRLDAFWDGQEPSKAFSEGAEVPPEGYHSRRPESTSLFGVVLEALRLPETVMALPQPEVEVGTGSSAGTATFERAVGSVLFQGRLRDAVEQTAHARGKLTVKAIEADETRRMTSTIEGTLLDFQVVGATQDRWGEYVPAAALAGGLVGGMGIYYLWPLAKFGATKWALFPLYARLKKEDILENPLRDDILEAVEASPGISASDLGRRLSCGWGTLVYHLTVLERMQLISSAREGRHRRFFVQGRINYSDKDAVALLANPHARNILDAIRAQPGLIQRDLSRTLGLSAGTVAWHVDRMAQTGLVVKEEEGRVVRYYPSQKLLELTKQLAA